MSAMVAVSMENEITKKELTPEEHAMHIKNLRLGPRKICCELAMCDICHKTGAPGTDILTAIYGGETYDLITAMIYSIGYQVCNDKECGEKINANIKLYKAAYHALT
jgi:hypothetical protein